MAAVLLYVCSAFVVWAVLVWPCFAAVSCPKTCDCLGVLTDCSHRGMVAVPDDLHAHSWGTKLDLKSNAITTLGPTVFKGLHNRKLELLDLRKNDVTRINGSIFAELVTLGILKVSHNKLTEMPVFPRHLNITELYLDHNMIRTVSAEALQSLPHLRILYLNHNEIMDLPVGGFASPSYLTQLYLSNNRIMRLEPGCLDNLTALKQLKLNKNQMFELKQKIFKTLRNLKFLELSHNEISQIQSLTFDGLENLEVLKLKRNSIATLMDGAFSGLSRITKLQLDHNNISNVTYTWLYGLESLEQLYLTYNRIGTIQQEGWECCKMNLKKLDLTHNQLKTIYATTFRKLAHLESLLLDHNQLTRIDDGAFEDLGELITLEMNDNAIAWTMADMSGTFNGLQKLTKLGLKMNHIKSITKQAFIGLRRLRKLHLEDNEITTIQENSFQPLQNLNRLFLNSTNLLCDCHIAWLPGWLRRYRFNSTVAAVCSYPAELRGMSIFDVPITSFKCSDVEIPRPVIVENPKSQNAFKGENMTLTCVAAITSKEEPIIKWKKNNVVLPDSLVMNLASSDGEIKRYTSRLHLTNIQDDVAGQYECVISNEFGSAFSHRALVNVYVFPKFIKKPEDITVKAGQSARLQCSATGQPQPVEISWHKDGDDFPAARERRMYVMPKDDHFFIASTRSTDEGVYTCRAQNEAGVITANATVTILETPDFIRNMDDEKTTRLGETSVLECMASGSPRPKLHWLKDAQPLEETPRHFLTADNQLLIIVETHWEDAGTYTCEMANTLGIKRGTTKLRVLSATGESRDDDGGSGLSDESTTTGIIIIAVVCCVVGTSLVWVIIIYQTRKRHEMYSATPTDETTLPGEVPSTGYSSSDKEGSFSQAPIGITTFHYQDYQLKESGYDTTSSGQYRGLNGWSGMRTSVAIFPSDVEEDEIHAVPHQHHHHQQLMQQSQPMSQPPPCYNNVLNNNNSINHRSTSISSLPLQQQHSAEDSDTMAGTTRSWHSHDDTGGGGGGGAGDGDGSGGGGGLGGGGSSSTSSSPLPPGAGLAHSGGANSTLSTFHPGPTNHDRCPSRSIALPAVCGENGIGATATGPTMVATTTQTPCPNCERCDERHRIGVGVRDGGLMHNGCDGCLAHQQHQFHHRHYPPENGGSYSDTNASSSSAHHQRGGGPAASTSSPPPRASSFSALPTGGAGGSRSVLRPVQGGGSGGGCCCQAVPCGQHKNGMVASRPMQPHPQHRHNEGCTGECNNCDRLLPAVCPACSRESCLHHVPECNKPYNQEVMPHTALPPPNGLIAPGSHRDIHCRCAQCGTDSVHYSPAPHPPHCDSASQCMQHPNHTNHNHSHTGSTLNTHHLPHRHKDDPVSV